MYDVNFDTKGVAKHAKFCDDDYDGAKVPRSSSDCGDKAAYFEITFVSLMYIKFSK
jgi:hypothetical protein